MCAHAGRWAACTHLWYGSVALHSKFILVWCLIFCNWTRLSFKPLAHLHLIMNPHFIHSIHSIWHVPNVTIHCCSQELLPFLSVIYLFLPPLSTNYLPSSLTSSCHLFLGLPLGLVHSKFIYNTLLGILFSYILWTCPNQCNLCNLFVSVMVGFFNNCINFFIS
jgi:hypothetical protein